MIKTFKLNIFSNIKQIPKNKNNTIYLFVFFMENPVKKLKFLKVHF